VRIARTAKWAAVTAVAIVAIVLVWVYLRASMVPLHYSPAHLSAAQRDLAAKEFLNRKVLDEFGNAAQLNKPFEWSITEEEMNRYLGSMDEIASCAPSVEPGTVNRAMAEAGLWDPAVAFRDGKLTLMVKSAKYEKVLSADLEFSFNDGRMLLVRLSTVRSGRLALPDSWLRERLDEVKASLSADLAGTGGRHSGLARAGGVSPLDVADVLKVVLEAIDSKPIQPVLVWPVSQRRVLVEDIRIADGVLTLRVTPAPG